MDTYLVLQSIAKRYAGNTALGGISLCFAKGQFVTVLGPSGCGKSTLLSVLSGILTPDSGRILLEGEDITGKPPEKRNFGMVFQNYALFPNLSVADNIAYGLFTLPRRQALSRTGELVELVGLSGLEKRFPAELSGGQRQRVALARALARKPSVLLLDEPLSALDAQVRLALGQELLRLQRTTGITTIMVTHDQQEALALADTVVLMENGVVVQSGTPRDLYEKPDSAFAADFIGHMNELQIPGINNGTPCGIRYEDVQVRLPSEKTLAEPHTWVGRVEHAALMGAYYRLSLLLNDFSTQINADIPRTEIPLLGQSVLERGSLVAVTFPEESIQRWGAV